MWGEGTGKRPRGGDGLGRGKMNVHGNGEETEDRVPRDIDKVLK